MIVKAYKESYNDTQQKFYREKKSANFTENLPPLFQHQNWHGWPHRTSSIHVDRPANGNVSCLSTEIETRRLINTGQISKLTIHQEPFPFFPLDRGQVQLHCRHVFIDIYKHTYITERLRNWKKQGKGVNWQRQMQIYYYIQIEPRMSVI